MNREAGDTSFLDEFLGAGGGDAEHRREGTAAACRWLSDVNPPGFRTLSTSSRRTPPRLALSLSRTQGSRDCPRLIADCPLTRPSGQ